MRLSKTELHILEQLAHGNIQITKIATAIRKSKPQIYRSIKKLKEKNMVEYSNNNIKPIRSTHTALLLQILLRFPSVITPFADSGIELLECLLEPRSIAEIAQLISINRTRVFQKIKQARAISLLQNANKQYILNEKLWKNVVEFLKIVKKDEETTDSRIPANAVIYFKRKSKIVFSASEEIDATTTAFSAFERCGIKLLSTTRDYRLPKKVLKKEEILQDALYITEKEFTVRNIIYIALFYFKWRRQLKRLSNPILTNIQAILQGKIIEGYPSYSEIKEKAEMYDIRI